MKTKTKFRSFRQGIAQFLTPQVWKQAHQAWPKVASASRWTLQPLVWVLLAMSWSCGGSEGERFAVAHAYCVACRQKQRRPGGTLQGFRMALGKLPMPVLRALAFGLRLQLAKIFVDCARIGGFVPLACDGSRLECPRAEELQRWLGEAGKPDSAPMMYLTALVLLPLGLPWSWCWGKGTASEHDHLRRLLPTLPERALIVADAFYQGYDLYTAILQAGASFLVRLSSRSRLYTTEHVPLKRFREGLVYYWPEKTAQDKGKPPILARLLRIHGKGGDVWLLTNVLDHQQLSHKTASRLYRWRWRNEGMFRHYKRMLDKVKLRSRTVALAHREAEGAMLALQLLLALAAQEWQRGRNVVIMGSPRQMLLRIRGDITAQLRSLGPRQFANYQRMLAIVRSEHRLDRTSPKVRQDWPRRKDHVPPKPPKIRVLSEALKAKMAKVLQAA